MAEGASNPGSGVRWTGLSRGPATGGARVGRGAGPRYGPPGVGVGTGIGLGAGGLYRALGRNHNWKLDAPAPGARYAIPEPSGAQVGWATSWSLITTRRGPRFEPSHDARTRYEICFW